MQPRSMNWISKMVDTVATLGLADHPAAGTSIRIGPIHARYCLIVTVSKGFGS